MITEKGVLCHVDTNRANLALSSTPFAFLTAERGVCFILHHFTLSPPFLISVRIGILERFLKDARDHTRYLTRLASVEGESGTMGFGVESREKMRQSLRGHSPFSGTPNLAFRLGLFQAHIQCNFFFLFHTQPPSLSHLLRDSATR